MERNGAVFPYPRYMCHNKRMPAGKKSDPGPLSIEIAAIINAEMGRHRLTRTAVAKAAGISRAQLGQILAAKKHVDVEQLDAICWVVGRTLRDVAAEADLASSYRYADTSWTAERIVPD